MFDFVCDHLIPGCTHRDSDKDKADLIDRAAAHIREHAGFDHDSEPLAQTLEKTGAIFIRPA